MNNSKVMTPSETISTRKRVLHLLKTQGPLSVNHITDELQITHMAVRRHLHILEKDGYIQTEQMRQAMGRPTTVYQLTPEAEDLFPKKYETLTLDLLKELVQETGNEMVDLLFERRKATLEKKYEPGITGDELQSKVASLANIQNMNGYMANWTQISEREYEIVEYNCPISQIANQYEQACQCELQLFESLLQADVSRTECLAKGGQKCVYKIMSRPQECVSN